jgi:hypothetical protein
MATTLKKQKMPSRTRGSASVDGESTKPDLMNAHHGDKVRQLLGQIDKSFERAHKNDGDIVRDRILLGNEIIGWKASPQPPGCKWADVLQQYSGMDPRVARRYMKLARASWAAAIESSELFAVLPGDLLKLEWLAKLEESQILDLCANDKSYLRRLERAELARIVKAILPAGSNRKSDPGRRLRTLARRLSTKATGILDECKSCEVEKSDLQDALDAIVEVVDAINLLQNGKGHGSPESSKVDAA